jgi:hypothetical protein
VVNIIFRKNKDDFAYTPPFSDKVVYGLYAIRKGAALLACPL